MQQKTRGQDGLVAIVIVSTIIIILSLMTIGFARIMDRESRQSLDRELATQAQYAAEAGLNDARAFTISEVKAGRNPATGPNCKSMDPPDEPFVRQGSISASYNQPGNPNPTDHTVKYTCVIINPTPKDLVFDINAGESKVIKVTPSSVQDLDNLFFTWENAGICPPPQQNCNPQPLVPDGSAGNPKLPQETAVSTDETGMLQVGLYPIPQPPPIPPIPVNPCNGLFGPERFICLTYASQCAADPGPENSFCLSFCFLVNWPPAVIWCATYIFSSPTPLNNDILFNASRTYFLYPNAGTGICGFNNLGCIGTISYSGGPTASFVNGQCHVNNRSSTTILPSPGAGGRFCNSVVLGLPNRDLYYLRLTALYQKLTVSIHGEEEAGAIGPLPDGAAIEFVGTQAIIDVTGEANDILRRVQARISLNDTFNFPADALRSLDALCKRFRLPKIGPGVGDYGPAVLDDANATDGVCAPYGP